MCRMFVVPGRLLVHLRYGFGSAKIVIYVQLVLSQDQALAQPIPTASRRLIILCFIPKVLAIDCQADLKR
jgi:hypothetical protein